MFDIKNIFIKKLLQVFIFCLIITGCVKETKFVPNKVSNNGPVDSPLDTTNNGWELLSSKDFTDMGSNSNQYFYSIKHIETHGNVADVFFQKSFGFNNRFSRWQIDIENKTEQSFVNIESFEWDIINFRSIGLGENSFEYVKINGYYKGLDFITPNFLFKNYNSPSNSNVSFSFLGDEATLMSNGFLARVVGEKYDYYITKNAYYEDQLFTIPHKGRLIHCTFDNNINENAINISVSKDSIVNLTNGSGTYRQDSMHLFDVVKTYKHLLKPTTFVHQGYEVKIYKIGAYFHIYLYYRMQATSGNRDIYHLKLDPENLILTKENSDYSNIYEKSGSHILLNDRPGYILRHYSNFQDEELTLFTGNAEQNIALPKLKPYAQKTLSYYYNKGRIFTIINFQNKLHLISKNI